MTETIVNTCLPLKGGWVPLSVFPEDTTTKLVWCLFTLSLYMLIAIFWKVFWYDLTKEPFAYRIHSRHFNKLSYAEVLNLKLKCKGISIVPFPRSTNNLINIFVTIFLLYVDHQAERLWIIFLISLFGTNHRKIKKPFLAVNI